MKTNNALVGVYDSTVHSKSKLIHEHDFIRIRTEETTSSLVRCTNCGEYYCDLCGKTSCDFTNEKIRQH